MRRGSIIIRSPGGRSSKLDAIDVRILNALRSNARLKLTELSEAAAISPTRCSERIKKLEKLGIIVGYRAELDLNALLGDQQFFVQVTITAYQHEKSGLFEAAVKACDQVLFCEGVLGPVDYFLVITAKDIDHYQRIIERLVKDSGVDFDYITYPRSRLIKSMFSVPLVNLLDQKG